MKKPTFSFGLIICALIFISGTIDLNILFEYSEQDIPNYILKDNTPPNNPVTDEGATLGRVLFYDKNLSANNTKACASCHQQAFAFGDSATQSEGLAQGLTGRHSMRLVNSRFADERRFFWDERARSLENQTTQPIQDHIEMGFSGTDGDPDIDDLIFRLEGIDYYDDLFTLAFGDNEITEERMQLALAQFVRSIQSFDSKFDAGLSRVNNLRMNFPNFTLEENLGKRLFLDAPPAGGAGCQGCHRAPEFDIDPNSQNNGIIGVAGDSLARDLTNTRAPSLRDLFNPDGLLNGPLMHNGSLTSLREVIDHYNEINIQPGNTNIDRRLRGPNGQGQRLNLTEVEKEALEAFLMTLTGSELYTEERWSDPFDELGNIDIIPLINTSVSSIDYSEQIRIYPNPAIDKVIVDVPQAAFELKIYTTQGVLVQQAYVDQQVEVNLQDLVAGMYLFHFTEQESQQQFSQNVIVHK